MKEKVNFVGSFTGVFIQDDSGQFIAFFSEFPEAVSQGDTLEEAEKQLFDTLPMVLEARKSLQEEANLINGGADVKMIRKSYQFQTS